MSRIGKKRVELNDAKCEFTNNVVTINGKKGKLSLLLPSEVLLNIETEGISVSVNTDEKNKNRLQGLYRALIQNMVKGVNEGYKKELEVVGLGYRIQLRGKNAVFALGYSHEIEFKAPTGIEFILEGQNKLIVSGIDKVLVGQTAADIKALRAPDAYKGKGVRYSGEFIKVKPGKSVKK